MWIRIHGSSIWATKKGELGEFPLPPQKRKVYGRHLNGKPGENDHEGSLEDVTGVDVVQTDNPPVELGFSLELFGDSASLAMLANSTWFHIVPHQELPETWQGDYQCVSTRQYWPESRVFKIHNILHKACHPFIWIH